jgi:hypothetical protein
MLSSLIISFSFLSLSSTRRRRPYLRLVFLKNKEKKRKGIDR